MRGEISKVFGTPNRFLIEKRRYRDLFWNFMLYIIPVIGNYVIQMKKSDKALDLQYTSGKKDHADREVCILST